MDQVGVEVTPHDFGVSFSIRISSTLSTVLTGRVRGSFPA